MNESGVVMTAGAADYRHVEVFDEAWMVFDAVGGVACDVLGSVGDRDAGTMSTMVYRHVPSGLKMSVIVLIDKDNS